MDLTTLSGPRAPSARASEISPAEAFFLGADIVGDPFPHYRRWLRQSPIQKCATTGFWYVCSHPLVTELLRHPNISSDRIAAMHRNLSAEQRVRHAPLLDSLSRWILYIDPPKHKEIRAVFNRALSNKMVQGLRGATTEIAGQLIDAVDPSQPWDLIQSFAYPLPVIVISELLGVPKDDRLMLKRWSDDIARFVGMKTAQDEIAQMANRSVLDISSYLKETIVRQRRSPRDNLLQKMMELADGGGAFTEDDLVANAVAIIFAGHETTTNLIANAFLELLSHPHQRAVLQANLADDAAVGVCVEECLRFDSPIQYISRVARAEIDVGGHRIEPGDPVVLVLGAANRDPSVWERPDEFDITRKAAGHVALGWGPHACSGASLARMETAIALQTILRRFPGLALDGDGPPEWHKDLGLRAMKRLMVAAS